MRPTRSAPWRTAWRPVILGSVLVSGYCFGPAYALDAGEDSLTVAEEQTVPGKDVVGESVGEPAAEDAPVEGEPGPGDAVPVPPDEMGDADDAGGTALPPAEGEGAEAPPPD